MTQQNGNDQSQRQLAPGVDGQEQVQQPGQKDQQGQKDLAEESQRGQDGTRKQEPQNDPKILRGQPDQPGPGQQIPKGQSNEGSSPEQR